MDAERFRTEVRAALQKSRANVDAFRELDPATPFSTVIQAYDGLTSPLNGWTGRTGLYVHVHPDAEMRGVCEELEQEIAAFATELSLDRRVYDRLASLGTAPDRSQAQKEELRLHEHALRDYRRSGVDRDEDTRHRIQKLQEELVKIGQEFDRNIITGGRSFRISEGHAGLAGLPDDFLASHAVDDEGAVVLSTDPTDRIPFMTYAERGDLRRDYYREVMNRAVPDNLPVLSKLLSTRHELAALLGYANWAEYVTEDKMSGSADVARDFVRRVIGLVRDRAQREYDELLQKKRTDEPQSTAVYEWERSYLQEKQKQVRHGFDSQSVRPYFPFQSVKEGVLKTSAELYGVRFVPRPEVEVWHPSVECFEIEDQGQVIARFYLDMHPRDHKFKHAAMFHVSEGQSGDALPEAALVCNFPEPTKGDPALLVHDQVTTFFHEFGHLLHHLFAGRQRFLSFSGISTEHDFVEVPSQMYEEWAWKPEVLASFARHYETGEPIPADLVGRMRAAEEYGKGLNVLQQMFYALLSITYYDRDPAALDLGEVMTELKREILLVPHEEGTHFQASFGHLHGYSAMYYTYMWSLVIAKDLFSRFEGDLMNRDTARDYRERVLAPGGSLDARDLVAGFLGREYAFDAFESWLHT